MGVEYGLFEIKSKKYIWLGKTMASRNGFQMPAERITNFLLDNLNGIFEIHSDMEDYSPSMADGWEKADDWCPDDDND